MKSRVRSVGITAGVDSRRVLAGVQIRRNALESSAYRPHLADGAYMLRRQRQARLETDAKLAAYATDRLTGGWTPEQIAGRLRLGIERGLRAVCAETVYGWIYRAGQKTERPWRYLTRHHARRRKRHGRASRDTIAEKTHISQRSDDADARARVGHWEADLVICRRSRPVLVLHERKTRITLMARLAGKTAGEAVAAMMAAFRRLVALAITWTARCAITHIWPSTPRRGPHGYFSKSWFRTGFDNLRCLLRTDPLKAVQEWHRIPSRAPQNPRVV